MLSRFGYARALVFLASVMQGARIVNLLGIARQLIICRRSAYRER